MKHNIPMLAVLLVAVITAAVSGDGDVPLKSEAAVKAMLNDFHQAAADADADCYFGHLAPEAIILGTDATERFTREQYIEMAGPHLARGLGWTTVATEQHVVLYRNRKLAWFEERLHRDDLGEMRGTGVAMIVDGEWKIVQYNTSFPVPNALARKLMEMIGELPSD